MRRMMDKMGLDMQEMPNVREVLIRTDKKEIILSKPEVTEMKSKDKSIFTITSDGYEEKELDVPIFSDRGIFVRPTMQWGKYAVTFFVCKHC